MIQVHRYDPNTSLLWDAFVADCWNGTFLATRKYLAYHKDRFIDQSLVFTDEGGRWLGVLPAACSMQSDVVSSHPGITFGGVLHGGALQGPVMLEVLKKAIDMYARNGFRHFQYKAIPAIYHRYPCEDDEYALFRLGAHLYRTDLLSVVNLLSQAPIQARDQARLRRLARQRIDFDQGVQYLPAMWSILEEQLHRNHGAMPTHNLAEIQDLSSRFPDRIQCTVALQQGRLAAATITYHFDQVVHGQYITATNQGRNLDSSAAIISYLITKARNAGGSWFDFGNSNERDGQCLNEGLHHFKKRFGSTGLTQRFYQIDLDE
ncbi:MAG: methicillin resistance protein [Sulfobacillus acidophilus]|uniref:Methicillin resistance protein n=1 Tax=Sulfobacillus acidophilus TaxID=53633 RepID=A0A2T2WNZ9_9FIRM|nr:MAG: methicillin resistance protein [Sulfobacillus acidophilus]